MRLARLLAWTIATALLAGGYVASQVAYFSGTAAQYAERIDSSEVKWLSAILVAVFIALWLLDGRAKGASD